MAQRAWSACGWLRGLGRHESRRHNQLGWLRGFGRHERGIGPKTWPSRLVSTSCQDSATGHHSLLLICSFTNHVLAQIALLRYGKETKTCKTDVYLLERQLGDRLSQLRGLGRHGSRQRQASCGSLRLPRCSPRDRVGFKPTAEFGWRHWPSALRVVVCVHLPSHATCGACHLRVLRRGTIQEFWPQ